MKAWVLLLILLTALIGGGVLWLRTELQIDGCLDRGGRWNYPAGKCEVAGLAARHRPA